MNVTLPLKALQCPLWSKRPCLMSSRWHAGPTYGLPPCPHLSGFDSFFGRTPLKGAPFQRPPGCVRGDWGKASLLVLASAAHPGGRRKGDQLWHIFLSLSTSNHSVPTHLPKEKGSYHPEDTGTRKSTAVLLRIAQNGERLECPRTDERNDQRRSSPTTAYGSESRNELPTRSG